MKYTNFRIIKKTEDYTHALVDEVSWFGLVKKTRPINKPTYSSYWRWTDIGGYTPDLVFDCLSEATKAQQDLESR